MVKKIRQFCKECNQITTQVRNSENEQWKCLCCESAKFRSEAQQAEIKKKAVSKKKLNLDF